MTDPELKLLITFVGIICALFGYIVSTFVFFWLEGRRRYLGQLAGLRVLMLISQLLYASLKNGCLDTSEIKLDWLTQYLDGIFKDNDTVSILRKLIELRSKLLSKHSDISQLPSLISEADQIKADSDECLRKHLHCWKRKLFLISQ